jgi:hypothetical protein
MALMGSPRAHPAALARVFAADAVAAALRTLGAVAHGLS